MILKRSINRRLRQETDECETSLSLAKFAFAKWFHYVTFPEKQAWIIGYRTDCVMKVRIAQPSTAPSPTMIGEEIDPTCGGQHSDDIGEDIGPIG
uniref:Uncharacterized protein n=1 Tax=Angiostrongylus cantonensis TaxID=6313 RepID=A0A0K0CUF7_ANGCA